MGRVFPTVPGMVCRWHMNKNVLAKARKVLGQVLVENPEPFGPKYRNSAETDTFMAIYHQAVNSETPHAFSMHCASLRALSCVMAEYLERHWWKYKEKVVRCWTDRYQHFGYQDTSIVEGTHAKMKRWLHNSRGDLLTVFKHFEPWWATTMDGLDYRVQYNTTIAPYVLQSDVYSAVVRVITKWALVETDKLLAEARQIVSSATAARSCSGRFRSVHGRPCIHELVSVVLGRVKLMPGHFDHHWRIKPLEENPMRVLEPAQGRSRYTLDAAPRTHTTNNGLYRTRREPSYSERVDQNHPAPAPSTVPGSVCILPPLSDVISNSALLPTLSSTEYEATSIPVRAYV